MTTDPIELALADLSVYEPARSGNDPSRSTDLWQRALAVHQAERAWWHRPRTWALTSAAALVLVSGLVLTRGVASLNGRRLPPPAAMMVESIAAEAPTVRAPMDVGGEVAKSYRQPLSVEPGAPGFAGPSAPAGPSMPAQRFVVRRATLEFTTRDVHALFAKAVLLPNTALGEFVETSSISGEGESTRAELTLRVTADRLSSVLNELRGLGTVMSEQAGGQDITDQVVDVDARLRNEQRIEQELLTLLTSKRDASLEDILRVQQELARVRGQIERMQAQRDSLGRLASLATVLVIIRHEAGREQPSPDGFGAAMARAWERGVRDLGGFTGGAVRLAVGGLPVWVVVGGAGFFAWRAWKRRRTTAADEPPPAL